MIFTTMSTWDNGSGCTYYTKEKFLEFDAEIMTDASCYLIEESKELT